MISSVACRRDVTVDRGSADCRHRCSLVETLGAASKAVALVLGAARLQRRDQLTELQRLVQELRLDDGRLSADQPRPDNQSSIIMIRIIIKNNQPINNHNNSY